MAVSKEGSRSCCAIAMPCDELALSFCNARGLGPSAEPHTRTQRTPKVLTVKGGALINCQSSGLSNMAMGIVG